MSPHPTVMTVNGPLPAGELGRTLIHEHLHMDALPLLAAHRYKAQSTDKLTLENAAEARWNPGAFLDNYRFTEPELIARELRSYVAAGGCAIVDATPRDLGRDPSVLAEIARAAGIHVVMGCGYYLEACHPPRLAECSADAIAAELIAEIRDGVDGSGIRPGMIGEIGTGDPITEAEKKVVRATARAQLVSGLCLSIHIHPWSRGGTEVAALLREEGVDPARVILNHISTAIDDEAYQRTLLDEGYNLAYDLFGFDHSLLGAGRYPPSDAAVAARVAQLFRAGHGRQLLISQDIGVRTRLLAYGGWGYAHLLTHVVPLLKGHGLSQGEVDAVLVANPARLLAYDS
jgi:phosphotriesterase-related protein